ncbi:hypothetical protein Pmani_036591 [Petrolisthes manimaculis]|uniref:PDZ domain-containing protein n=1 Tax=Petrolisthes manimaculis TaxID=1843537 RepID=A0AAE1TMI8_9EUCA|nr:hypothetical protein Pmani_036591 [Petrolisthes manimaculis]
MLPKTLTLDQLVGRPWGYTRHVTLKLRCVGPEEEAGEVDGGTSASTKPTPSDLTLNLSSPTSLLPPTSTHDSAEVVSPINVYKASVLMVPVATERLIGSSTPGSLSSTTTTTTTVTTTTTISSTTLVSQGSMGDDEGGSPHSSPQLSRWAHAVPSLPRDLERTIKIKKGADQMGVNIEVVDQGVNGVVVSSLVRNGAVHKDGRLHAGDLILSVNNESMRNITNSQARAILRRTQLVSTDVSILFIRGQDAAAYREASLLQYRGQQQQQQLLLQQQQQLQQGTHQTSPRSPYVPRGESSEDETPGTGEVGGDLTRSITAPSFITRDIPSRDPSQEDLLGSLSNLPPGQQQQGKTEGLSVINIKHALSETLVESRSEDVNVSSVHIGGEERRDTVDGEEEGPFTITFKNVSAAPREFSPRLGQEPEGEDHEVVEVLQAEGGISVAASEGRSNSASPMLDGKHWGPERTVEVQRDEKNSLGISIVGGKVDLSWSGSSVTGIFIKNVLPDSPAGKGGHLKTGDRILEVEGIDLRGATHEKAVEVIKKTGNPVTFLVQSLVQWTPANSRPGSRDVSRLGTRYPSSISPARTPTPELIQASTPLSDASTSTTPQHPRPPLQRHQRPPCDPLGPPIPETSTPIHETFPEPVRFVSESPICEPEDPDPLVNPYYYYARAALAHWHVRAQRTKEPKVEEEEEEEEVSDRENSTSTSSDSSADSRHHTLLRFRSFCPNYGGVQQTRPNGSKIDTPPSDGPPMDTPPSDVPTSEDSPQEEIQQQQEEEEAIVWGSQSSDPPLIDFSCEPTIIGIESNEPLEIYSNKVQSSNLVENETWPNHTDLIDLRSDSLTSLGENKIVAETRIVLEDMGEDEEPVEGYDWRRDPHLYQGWWCVGGSVSEHLAAQVPTQPVSPYESPAHSPTSSPTHAQRISGQA